MAPLTLPKLLSILTGGRVESPSHCEPQCLADRYPQVRAPPGATFRNLLTLVTIAAKRLSYSAIGGQVSVEAAVLEAEKQKVCDFVTTHVGELGRRRRILATISADQVCKDSLLVLASHLDVNILLYDGNIVRFYHGLDNVVDMNLPFVLLREGASCYSMPVDKDSAVLLGTHQLVAEMVEKAVRLGDDAARITVEPNRYTGAMCPDLPLRELAPRVGLRVRGLKRNTLTRVLGFATKRRIKLTAPLT